jgi:hypothetical protein
MLKARHVYKATYRIDNKDLVRNYILFSPKHDMILESFNNVNFLNFETLFQINLMGFFRLNAIMGFNKVKNVGKITEIVDIEEIEKYLKKNNISYNRELNKINYEFSKA